jgi:ubiquinone/menaquinone biosynthesis C-methylase UbiE
MGIYARHIFPRLLDWSLGTPEVGEQRRLTLAAARGEVLEVGFGTGLNLLFYPQTITKLVALDAESMLPERVRRRAAAAAYPVERVRLDAGGRLPFDDRRFDTVVTTFTLCSIGGVRAALKEMRRVLKVGGEFLFCEHGRSDDVRTARWQDRLNPLQNIVACGCNMNRPVDRLIGEAGFEIVRLDRFLMPRAPRLLGEMYRGAARP